MRRCPRCGEENPDRFRLCGFCGAELAPQTPTELRKTVTIVFSDLKGSTSLGERLDPEALREVLTRYFDTMKAILERHGGTVEKYIGDAIMAVFGLPKLHEDDAVRAVRAAVEMRTALADLNSELDRRWGIRLVNRTGVNTGEVVAGDAALGQRLVTGDTVNVTARLEQAAPDSDVLIGESTHRLVEQIVEAEPVEPLTLKGKSEPVPAYRLIAVRTGEWFARRLEAPLIGRANDLQEIRAAYARAIGEHRLELVTIVGHAGMGKTRLISEALRRFEPEALILRGRCFSYGEGMTFWPLSEIVRGAVGALGTDPSEQVRRRLADLLGDDAVVDRLSSATGLSTGSFSIQETSWAARRFVEILGTRRPLVVLFEDIHWAEPTLLNLIENVADTAKNANVLFLCAARHDLFDDHPKWMEGRTQARRIILEPLSPDESDEIITNLFESASLPLPIRRRVIANADGNPLYVEQMLSMLVDDGVLRRDDQGRWVAAADSGEIKVPPTISALIDARLDKLPSDERGVLDVGSVAGLVFYEDAVRELSPPSAQEEVTLNLMVLAQKQLVRDELSMVPDVRAFRFAHVLVREATYRRLLKRTRASLHELFAGWLERVTVARALEYEALIGYHFEQACQYLDDLGPRDAHTEALARRAFELLASAGRRASGRGDMPAAANLIERATAVRGHEDAPAIELAVDLADALREMAEFDRAHTVVEKALAAPAAADERLRASLRLVQLLVERSYAPQGWAEVARRDAERAVTVFERSGDHVGMARAFRLLATIHGIALRYRMAQQVIERAIEESRAVGDVRQEVRSVSLLALCAVLGPQPAPDAIALCERLVEQTAVDRRTQSGVLYALAPLYAMTGDFSNARATYRRGRRTLEDLGDKLQVAFTALYAARIELLAGDPAAAEAELRPAYETLFRAGERSFVPTAAALLAHAAHELGRDDEALALCGVSEERASASDVESQYRWRCVRAKVLAKRGDPDALRIANEALELVAATDATEAQADVYATRGEVRAAGNDRSGGEADLRRATELYALKGDVVSAQRVALARAALLSSTAAETAL